MRTTLGQEDTAHLRIGSEPVLIAAAPKRRPIGGRIRRVEDRAIDSHEPIAPKEGTGHGGWLGDDLTALLHQRLQPLAAQGLATSTES